MEIRHLRYFLALGKELHFGRAADKLFITQPALTKQIQQLEEELDTKLLKRTKRSVSLTPAGEYFMQEAEYLMNHLDRVVDATKRKGEGEEGEIRIGFVGSAMQQIIPSLLERMSLKFPTIHASLDELNNKDQLNAIANDKLDIGFVRLESVHDGYQQKVVMEDSFSLVVSGQHPIQPKDFKHLNQFENESFILFSNDYSQEYYDNIMSIFSDHNFKPKVSHRSVQANSIFRLVERQLGVAIVPSALQGGIDLDVEFISLDHLPQRTKLMAIWNGENRNEALDKVLRLL
ncbi:LysR family transcriptional regulator [Roseivirga misakiensis]|uniref:Transcriptional regulator n=1 Tax=Roseivirga misakiensis TaxID=1563681 RepID=A0A1E5SLC5_9BACT|nr:LysR family transcriptional regulator [Roseivirga misakiensis]OEJ99932.1 transcriptional regulator [Roseivirga misakiensis]